MGFARFLHVLATFDWPRAPFVVEFDGLGALSDDERLHIRRSFETQVKVRGPGAGWVGVLYRNGRNALP